MWRKRSPENLTELSWKGSALIKIFKINSDGKKTLQLNRIISCEAQDLLSKNLILELNFTLKILCTKIFTLEIITITLLLNLYRRSFFRWLFYKWFLKIVLIQKWWFFKVRSVKWVPKLFFKQKSKKLSILTPLDITIIWTCHRDSVVQSRNFGWFLRFHFKPQRKNIFLRYLT